MAASPARDKSALLTKLREVVPPPTSAGLRDFARYRQTKESERELREEARRNAESEQAPDSEEEREFRLEQLREPEEEREHDSEPSRKPQDEFEHEHDSEPSREQESAYDRFMRDYEQMQDQVRRMLAARIGVKCFVILGLGTDATLEEVKRRHRELAKVHHPDRGGDACEFRRFQEAYEQACDFIELFQRA